MPIARAIVLQHLDREGAGLIGELLLRRGIRVDPIPLDHGAAVPASLAADEILVVMGGSMGVADIVDPRFPFLAPEVELLRGVLAAKRPVLGVCLGAQLLAHAAGSRVFPNQRADAKGIPRPLREVGFGEVHLLGREHEPALAGLDAAIPVLHWHGDTFDLPVGATHLAKSEACVNQAFRLGERAYGLQFHVEIEAETVRRWAEEDADYVVGARGPEGPAAIAAASEAVSREVRRTGERLLGNIIIQMLGS
jgi:GMP synthase-like glutamine amidotransferase